MSQTVDISDGFKNCMSLLKFPVFFSFVSANLCHPKKSKGRKGLLSFQVKNKTAISTQKQG